MVLLLNGRLDKPSPRLATLAKRALVALALLNTKAGSPLLSKAHLFRSTFGLLPPAMPTFLAVRSRKSSEDEGRLGATAKGCRFGPGRH